MEYLIAFCVILAFAVGAVAGILAERRSVERFIEGQRSGWALRDVAGVSSGEAHVPDAEVPLQKPLTLEPFVFSQGEDEDEPEPE